MNKNKILTSKVHKKTLQGNVTDMSKRIGNRLMQQ